MADPRFKTGAIPTPRHRLAAATPYRVRGAAPQNYLVLPSWLNMWGNSTYGDCVTAEEAFNKACSGIRISEQTVIDWARQHNVLEGAMLDEVLDWMASGGFGQDGDTYNDGGKAAVDWTNPDVLRNAVCQGTLSGGLPSPVKLGLAAGQLQGNGVGEKNGWVLTGLRKDQNIDHCTSAAGVAEMGFLAQCFKITLPSGVRETDLGVGVYTWSTVGIMDYAGSFLNIVGEAWSRTPASVVQGTNPPPPDQVQIFQDPAPTPPAPPTPPVAPGFVQQLLDNLFDQAAMDAHGVPFVGAKLAALILEMKASMDQWFDAHVMASARLAGLSVKQIVDAVFASLEVTFASRPLLMIALPLVQQLVDNWLVSHGYQASARLRCGV